MWSDLSTHMYNVVYQLQIWFATVLWTLFFTAFAHFYCFKFKLHHIKTRGGIWRLHFTTIWLTCPSRLICTFLWSFHGLTRWWACWNGILALWSMGERNVSYTWNTGSMEYRREECIRVCYFTSSLRHQTKKVVKQSRSFCILWWLK